MMLRKLRFPVEWHMAILLCLLQYSPFPVCVAEFVPVGSHVGDQVLLR